ncbi:MAG: hypothetical protein LBT59_01975 [Clostridiales bacterium]|nr:hypothetical protein [Clostridiales bacterium]
MINSIAATINQFATGSNESVKYGETLGRIVNDSQLCYYNYLKLDAHMKAEGFSMEEVLAGWAEKKYICPYVDANGKPRYSRSQVIAGVKIGCLWINMPQDIKLEIEIELEK